MVESAPASASLFTERVTVSVIVPFFNAEKTLTSCINALLRLEGRDFEVLLIDNNSTDGSATVARTVAEQHPERFYYCTETRQGPVFARNHGAALARGEILAFIDADCLVQPAWLSEMVRAFEDPRIGAVAGKIGSHDAATVFDKFHALFTFRGPRNAQTFNRFALTNGGFPTANLAVRKEIFQRIGGFDPALNLLAGEDYDLCARIYREGFHIRYEPTVEVDHIHRNSLTGTWKQSYIFGTGHALLLKKLFKNKFILELPGYSFESEKPALRAWINLASADKKLIGLLALTLIWWPLSSMTVFYLLYLFQQIKQRSAKDHIKVTSVEIWALVFLLFLKSAAMTMGRIDGALKNRILCF